MIRKNKKNIKNIGLVMGLTATVSGSIYIGNVLTSKGILPSYAGYASISDVTEFEKLFEIRETLYKWYDGEIDDSILAEGAIKGMVSSLEDPYTYFMNESEYATFKEQSEGNYMGIGVQVSVKDNKITVITPIDNSPAQKSGIMSGDIITSVNGVEVNGESLETALSMIKGTEKELLTIGIYRENKGDFDVQVQRDVIETISVTDDILQDNIGYISISSFDSGVSEKFIESLTKLKESNIKGLILDLRGNPGGLMKECVTVASQFIEKGKVIVSTVDKNGKVEENISTGGIAQGMPLVVLINGGTASASEVVSGAIRDYNLGTLVGETSFGKGVVQVVLDDKSDNTALKVTISKYYTPNGENIHSIGIKPHVEVEYLKDSTETQYSKDSDRQLIKAIDVMKEKLN